MKQVHLDINTEALEWARNRARYSQAELAQRLGVSHDRYRYFESGEAQPTIRQVTRLVRILNRSLQFFFMRDIPDEPEPLAELRRLPGSQVGEESPELAEQVHIATERREVALRLFEDLGEQPARLGLSINQRDDPEAVGSRIRAALGIDLTEQASWSDEYEALRSWRSLLENAGILVFQIPGVSVNEMRGFSFAFDPLPIIGFNSKDWPRGRIFTIFHELVHILLDDTVLDSVGDSWFHLDSDYPTEFFCNRVAAAVLIPSSDIRLQSNLRNKSPNTPWLDYEIDELSSRYQVSRAVVVRRLNTVEAISESSFLELRARYDGEMPDRPDRPEPSGGDFYRNRLAHLGGLIPRLAYRAYYQDRATVSDLSMLLGMKAENLGKFEERVLGTEYGFRST